jgi:hypothetical protein
VKKLLFERSKDAYLPEIDAYINYLNTKSNYVSYDSSKVDVIDTRDFDLIWKFMGTDFSKSSIPVVHDYASLSVGKFPRFKNKLKKYLNVKPDLRVFLNDNIKEEFNFNDNTPSTLRDMGINSNFFLNNNSKEYDFVYMGALTEERNIGFLLDSFINKFRNESLLLIGQPSDEIFTQYKKFKNLIFTGRLKQLDIPNLASKAEYGLNFIPNKYPYNLQTSTKLLEYLAMNLKIVTTESQWLNQFESQNQMKFFKLNEDLSNFHDYKTFNYLNKSVEKYDWNNILDNSKIINYLNDIFK